MQGAPKKPVSEASKEEEVMLGTLAKEVTVEMPEGQKRNMSANPLQGNPLSKNLLVSEKFKCFQMKLNLSATFWLL